MSRTGTVLLDLPPELRTAIYEFALVERDHVVITPHLRPPSLIYTCRVTRREASPVWADLNTFLGKIDHCDGRLLNRFAKFRLSLGKVKFDGYFLDCAAQSHWANLVSWSREIWGAGWLSVGIEDDVIKPGRSGDFITVMKAAHTAAAEARNEGKDWENVERELKRMRKVAGRMDAEWLKDY